MGDVSIRIGRTTLNAELAVPDGAFGVVAFAHGSGSSRASPRNRAVAAALGDAGIATLLFDLLTPDEDRGRAPRFDIGLLAERLAGAIEWLHHESATGALPIGLYGASTGAAAAIVAAAHLRYASAIVSRGGRIDLAGDALADVDCPTLLVVGQRDVAVLELTRIAMRRMHAPTVLHVVDGAGHLFEEPGALDEVTTLATAWFRRHLIGGRARTEPHELWQH